eukprot:CAMPEP_0197695906 /NCGR_PEP_ID=MMETSP1338-20131121/115863_1 /TAXON_ID=43686 ORGANISM="Pelagodinium beii, Strain RCC1491" /NCGR_SAMPLE_ID=MMETSP1338 /ASSEMBLY_ACC=CAM_ASM_000754 /LENGTH=46 /DNA_ID= /DNA_START= /DNA_END= /DNA_ORIENTATION=
MTMPRPDAELAGSDQTGAERLPEGVEGLDGQTSSTQSSGQMADDDL